MLSSPNILFIKDVVQISTEQLDGVVFLLNSLFNRFFSWRKCSSVAILQSFHPLPSSPSLKHPLHLALHHSVTSGNLMKKKNVLAQISCYLPLLNYSLPVAELRTNTVLWSDSRVERTSSAE